jgi:hypothetical protein
MQSKGFNVRVRGAGNKSEEDEEDDDEDEDDNVEVDDNEDGIVRSNGKEDKGGPVCEARDKSESPIVAGSAGESDKSEIAAEA